MSAGHRPSRRADRRAWLGVALGGAAAVLMGAAGYAVHLRYSCVVGDTPYLGQCPTDEPGSQAHLQRLRERLARNPGDTAAYVQLALHDDAADAHHGLRAAAQVAPHHPQLLLAQAARAAGDGQWADVALPLVQLVEHHAHPAAAEALARLIGGGQGQVLLPHLRPGSRWLPRVLAQLPNVKAPPSTALALVAQAHLQRVLAPAEVGAYLRQLKAAGAWADAFSLWAAMNGGTTGLLHNGGFEQPLVPDGFDWEAPAQPVGRAGLTVERPALPKRGLVLELRFTGKALPVPLLRQYVFLGEGRYRLSGEYRTQQLRTEHGLAWVLRCSALETGEAARSAPLAGTGGSWQPFNFDFEAPRGCGAVASLQLEPYAPFEAATGLRGRAAFDHLSLQAQPPPRAGGG